MPSTKNKFKSVREIIAYCGGFAIGSSVSLLGGAAVSSHFFLGSVEFLEYLKTKHKVPIDFITIPVLIVFPLTTGLQLFALHAKHSMIVTIQGLKKLLCLNEKNNNSSLQSLSSTPNARTKNNCLLHFAAWGFAAITVPVYALASAGLSYGGTKVFLEISAGKKNSNVINGISFGLGIFDFLQSILVEGRHSVSEFPKLAMTVKKTFLVMVNNLFYCIKKIFKVPGYFLRITAKDLLGSCLLLPLQLAVFPVKALPWLVYRLSWDIVPVSVALVGAIGVGGQFYLGAGQINVLLRDLLKFENQIINKIFDNTVVNLSQILKLISNSTVAVTLCSTSVSFMLNYKYTLSMARAISYNVFTFAKNTAQLVYFAVSRSASLERNVFYRNAKAALKIVMDVKDFFYACFNKDAFIDEENWIAQLGVKSILGFLLKMNILLLTVLMCISGPFASGALTFAGTIDLMPNFTALVSIIALVDILMTAGTENWHTLELGLAIMGLIDGCCTSDALSETALDSASQQYFNIGDFIEDSEEKELRLEEKRKEEIETGLENFSWAVDRICLFRDSGEAALLGSINHEQDQAISSPQPRSYGTFF